MASSAKNPFWSNLEDEKLLDLLLDLKAQGATKFYWTTIKFNLRTQTNIDREPNAIRNHYNDLSRKFRAWEWLVGQTGNAPNVYTGESTVDEERWNKFLEKYGGKYKSFRSKPPANVEKMRSLFNDRHATGAMGSPPRVITSGSNDRQMGTPGIDANEPAGENDDTDDQARCIGGEESRSSVKSIHTSFRKRNSSGESSMSGKRRELIIDLEVRDQEVDKAITVFPKKRQSLYYEVQEKLKSMPDLIPYGRNFIFEALEYIRKADDAEYFLALDDDFALKYLMRRICNL